MATTILGDLTTNQPHARLRSRPRPHSPPPKSQPTCTVSLATAGVVAVPFPVEQPVPFPAGNDVEEKVDSEDGMPFRRVRARTTHVVTRLSSTSTTSSSPLRPSKPAAKSRKSKRSQPLSLSSAPRSAPSPTPLALLAPTDLRLTALIERIISNRLRDLEDAMETDDATLDEQDALLAVRLRATLARNNYRPTNVPRSPPPMSVRVSAPSVASAVLSGPGVPTTASVSNPSPALRFVLSPWTGRSRSASTQSTASLVNNASPMSGVVARVVLRRSECGRALRSWEDRERLRAMKGCVQKSGLRREIAASMDVDG